MARTRAPRDAAVQHCLEYLALSIRILSSREALGQPYSSRVYLRKLLHALRTRRSTSIDRSALWLTFPPRYTNSFVGLHTWAAASTLNVAVDSGEAKRRAHNHDYPHHFPQLLGRLRNDPGIVNVKHAPK